MAKKVKRARPPIHPGEILLEEFMKPLGISANKLGLELRVPSNRVLEITAGKRGVSADTALRLARYFGNSAEFWVNLQARYDLESASESVGASIEREVNPRAA